ncbi:MAG: hypothetical protein AB7S26_19040 [Sandaracinaceae bacterium]
MPVFSCQGPDCRRLISVSAIPGGNPTALAEPEKFAVVHERCTACGARFCDRCLEPGGACLDCGAPTARPDPDEARRMILEGHVPAGGKPLAVLHVRPPEPTPRQRRAASDGGMSGAHLVWLMLAVASGILFVLMRMS